VSAVTIEARFAGSCECGNCDRQWYEAGTKITWLEHPQYGWAIKKHLDPEEAAKTCPTCFMALTPAGACPNEC
jgi:hypothetical protein